MSSELTCGFTWADAPGAFMAADVTTGAMQLTLDGAPLWPAEFTWSWIELLEWLATSWHDLLGEEFPFGEPVTANALEGQVRLADLNLRSVPAAGYASWAEWLWQTQQTHDLAAALAGATGPVLSVYRLGDQGFLLTAEEVFTLPWPRVQAWLEQLGDAIVAQLEAHPPLDPRALAARGAWLDRNLLTA